MNRATATAGSARACACCGGSAPTMSDYIDWGLRRRRRATLPLAGEVCRDDAGNHARFSVAFEAGVIADVTFEASPCVTLVAYCELLCRRVHGLTPLAAAALLRPQELAAELPLVPAAKRPRALLASRALAAVLIIILSEERA